MKYLEHLYLSVNSFQENLHLFPAQLNKNKIKKDTHTSINVSCNRDCEWTNHSERWFVNVRMSELYL